LLKLQKELAIIFEHDDQKSNGRFIMFPFKPMIGIPAETNGPKNQTNKVTVRKSNAKKSSKSL